MEHKLKRSSRNFIQVCFSNEAPRRLNLTAGRVFSRISNIELNIKKFVKNSIQVLFGEQAPKKIRRTLNRIHFRISNISDYRKTVTLAEKPLDIIFLCDHLIRWPNIKLVIESTIHRHPDLKIALVATHPKEHFKSVFDSFDVPIFYNIPLERLDIFKSKVIYATYAGLSPVNVPPNMTMIYSHMTMASHDALFDEPSFDAYDYILCSGTHHIDSFRALQNRRPSFVGKVLIPSGYPKLEYLMSQASTNASAKRISQKAAFVYAPTHVYKENERLASFGKYGEEIVDALMATGQHLIFRPHPTSLVDEDCGVVDRILRKYSDDRNFTFDNSIDYIASYSSADLMITDLSGTGFTFSFAFTRPTVFFAPFQDAEQGLSGIQFDGRHRIGALARSIEEMISEIARLQKTDLTQQIVDFRNETLFNVGHSHEYIADCVNDIVQGRSRSEWIQL